MFQEEKNGLSMERTENKKRHQIPQYPHWKLEDKEAIRTLKNSRF